MCTTTGRLLFEIGDIPEPCDSSGRLRRRLLFELGYIHERKLDKLTQEESFFHRQETLHHSLRVEMYT